MSGSVLPPDGASFLRRDRGTSYAAEVTRYRDLQHAYGSLAAALFFTGLMMAGWGAGWLAVAVVATAAVLAGLFVYVVHLRFQIEAAMKRNHDIAVAAVAAALVGV